MKKSKKIKHPDKKDNKEPKQGHHCVVEMNVKFYKGSCCDSSLFGHDFSDDRFFLSKIVHDKGHQKELHSILIMSGYKNKVHSGQVLEDLEKRHSNEQIHLILYGSCLFQEDYFLKEGNYLETQLKNISKVKNIKRVPGCPPHADDLKDEIGKIIKTIIES